MFDLKKPLNELKRITPIHKLSIEEINREMISKHFIRYRFLELMKADIAKVIASSDRIPLTNTILDLQPIEYGADVYSIERVALQNFKIAAKERETWIQSMIDIISYFKCSVELAMKDIDHIGDREFIQRISTENQYARDLRRVEVSAGCFMYFKDYRYMALINRQNPNDYYISVFDLGEFFATTFSGRSDFGDISGISLGQFNKIPFYGRPHNVDRTLIHWDVLDQEETYPVQYFISRPNVRRDTYTFDIVFKSPIQTAYGFEPDEWENIKQYFNIPSFSHAMRASDQQYYIKHSQPTSNMSRAQ